MECNDYISEQQAPCTIVCMYVLFIDYSLSLNFTFSILLFIYFVLNTNVLFTLNCLSDTKYCVSSPVKFFNVSSLMCSLMLAHLSTLLDNIDPTYTLRASTLIFSFVSCYNIKSLRHMDIYTAAT